MFSTTPTYYPENICWSWRCLEDVLETSWRRLGRQKIVTLKTSLRRLEDIEDVLKTCLEDVLKTCLEVVLKTSWRHYGDKQNTYSEYLYLANLNVYLTNLYLTNLNLTILRRIQNAWSRTHHFNTYFILEIKQHLYFKN